MQVGRITPKIIALLGLKCEAYAPIMMNASNLAHMQSSHPNDYAKYGDNISFILAEPDYVGVNPTDGSIEYVKEYIVNGEYVKVAVRISSGGTYYARSLYILNRNRALNFIRRGTLKKL